MRIAAGSDFIEGNTITDLGETFCRRTIFSEGVLAVSDAAYIGGKIEADGELYGTVCFVDREPCDRPFTEVDRTFVDLVTRWIARMVERQEYDRDELIGADASLVFAAENPALDSLSGEEPSTDREPNYLETPVRTVDGEAVPCEVSGVAVADVVDGAQADVTGVVRRVGGE